MLEEKLKDFGKKNLEVRLIYKNNLDGIVVIMIWHDPKHCYTLRTERLIKFNELNVQPAFNEKNIFEFNLANILGNMAIKILKRAEHYTHTKGENHD